MIEYDIKQEKNKITVNVKLKKRSGRDRLICVTTNAIMNYLNEQKIDLKGFGSPDHSPAALDNESGPWERTLILSREIPDKPKETPAKPQKKLDKPKKSVVSSSKTKKPKTA
jgi:hypothetical protein